MWRSGDRILGACSEEKKTLFRGELFVEPAPQGTKRWGLKIARLNIDVLPMRIPLQMQRFPLTCLAVSAPTPYNTPPCEAPMPFSIHPHRRFPVQCAPGSARTDRDHRRPIRTP